MFIDVEDCKVFFFCYIGLKFFLKILNFYLWFFKKKKNLRNIIFFVNFLYFFFMEIFYLDYIDKFLLKNNLC